MLTKSVLVIVQLPGVSNDHMVPCKCTVIAFPWKHSLKEKGVAVLSVNNVRVCGKQHCSQRKGWSSQGPRASCPGRFAQVLGHPGRSVQGLSWPGCYTWGPGSSVRDLACPGCSALGLGRPGYSGCSAWGPGRSVQGLGWPGCSARGPGCSAQGLAWPGADCCYTELSVFCHS